jgi:hypothetical protein
MLLGGIPSVQNIHSQPPAPRYAEIYDPSTDNFSGLDDLTMSRQGYTVTLLRSGEVFLVGGKILDLVVSTTELLDPTTGALSASHCLLEAIFFVARMTLYYAGVSRVTFLRFCAVPSRRFLTDLYCLAHFSRQLSD